MEFFVNYGLIGLFLAAFLAATLLPLSSEALLLLVISQTNQIALPVAVASLGNILGSQFNYYLGYKGDQLLLKRLLRMSDDQIGQAQQRFKKFGTCGLLLAWLPMVGDPLTVAAGLFKINFILFTVLVSAGKISRYVLIACGFRLF